jgi:hypothetical protein
MKARDQEQSAFSLILGEVIRRLPGAFAAVLVDSDGECVDYAIAAARPPYDVEPFDVKVAGAHWAIAIDAIPPMAPGCTIICRGDKRSFLVRTLPDAYSLVVMLKRRAGFASFTRALDACERALAREAEWKLDAGRGVWVSVDVETDERRRPVWLSTGALSSSVEVLGGLTKLGHRERGWRVRLPSGGELNLIREPGNHWYADEKLA